MKFKMNLDDVKSGYITAGKHKAKVFKVETGDGANGKYLKWHFKVLAGESKGKEINAITSLSPTALWKLKELLEACAYSIPKGQFTFDTEAIVGSTLVIDCALGKPNKEGKQYIEVAKFLPLSTSAEATKGSAKLDDVDEDMGDDEDDEDVPF